ncbi:hypothetical protein ANCDUO_21409 [Ancylostoma duodenale]|uniref:Uncharacterized protein n=1 Tax=Ancylostoma duodenale TaxID=51022 RepID=A0A0C2FUE3_9BILA|nr:hypothetical protein ANCDUO_21409 [Ancylostoma duodenale]
MEGIVSTVKAIPMECTAKTVPRTIGADRGITTAFRVGVMRSDHSHNSVITPDSVTVSQELVDAIVTSVWMDFSNSDPMAASEFCRGKR